MKKFLIMLAFAAICIPLSAEHYKKSLFNDGWTFTKDGEMKAVTLPHDWGVEGPFEQVYPGETGKLAWWGQATYSKTFSVPEDDMKLRKRYWLDIDGAMSHAKVYCNGSLAGEWPYGYASFMVNLTPFIHEGENRIEVTLDNPENSSRWYPGGGLYRNVWLTVCDPVGSDHNGTYITTPYVSAESATVKVRTTLRNDTDKPAKGTVTTFLCYDDKAFSKDVVEFSDLKENKDVEQSFSVSYPRLWSPDSPERYCAITEISTSDGVYSDTVYTYFGIRKAECKEDGFYLNGEKTFLKGVCLHHDAGAIGAAWNYSAWIRRLNMLKDMGCNAIRTSHNPPAPELLELCDVMGFLVMDELTDTWTIPKKPNGYATIFDEWARKDMEALIKRDRNHPSVVMWSIGNECGEQGYADKWYIPQMLTDICHTLDPTRPTTSGNDNPWASAQPYHETVDVYGFNYKPHLYKSFHEANPTQTVLGSETASCVSTRGYYKFPVEEDKSKGEGDFQVSSYDLYAPAWASKPDYEWAYEDSCSFVAGEFVWTGFDYLGEPTPYNVDYSVLTNFHDPESKAKAEAELASLTQAPPPSRSSYFGIIDLAGFHKDRYYLYQARWRPDLPMVHILPHWNWKGREGQVTPIHVYTSGDSAELFINGVSKGRKSKGPYEYRIRWDDVTYEPGKVLVVAYKDGNIWATDEIKTSGEPKAIEVAFENGHGPMPGFGGEQQENYVIKDDYRSVKDLVFVDIRIVDAKGNFVPTANNKVKVTISGPAEFVFNDSGAPTSHTPFYSDTFNVFNGRGSFGVRVKDFDKVKITVSSDGLESGGLIMKR